MSLLHHSCTNVTQCTQQQLTNTFETLPANVAAMSWLCMMSRTAAAVSLQTMLEVVHVHQAAGLCDLGFSF